MSAIKEKIVHAKEKIAQVKEYVENGVWEVDDSALPLPKRFCIRANKSLSLLRHMYLEAVPVNTMTVLQNDIS